MNSRRDFLKRIGVGAAAIGAGAFTRDPLPSEANYKTSVGRPVADKSAVYDRVNHVSWSEPTFIKKCGEFKKGDILLHIDKRLIEVNVPCSLNALYSYVWDAFDDFVMMGSRIAMICPTREWAMIQNGWRFKDEASLKNVRNGGFEYIGPGLPEYEDYTAYSQDRFVYMGVHTMGAVGFNRHLSYRTNYDFRGGGNKLFHFKGAVNEVIKVRRDMKWLEIECDGKGYHHVFDAPIEPMCYRFPFQTEGL